MTHLSYEIYYRPLAETQSTLRFPCDVQGHVDLDELSPESVENYLFARAMVGRDYARPAVVAQHPTPLPATGSATRAP
jgi:hypothetical protein